MTIIAKYKDKIVEIVKTQHIVQFSKELDWILISHQINKKDSLQVKWVPASTRFTWVRDFSAFSI
jgi:hypothetical protein